MNSPTCIDLLSQWRRQIDRRCLAQRPPRGIAALGFMVSGPDVGDLVELHRVTVMAIYDERQASENLVTRVVGFKGSRSGPGVQWGGPENARFDKDLALTPRPGGGMRRLDLLNVPTLTLALRLNRRIDMALRYTPGAARRHLRLPRLWAAFDTASVEELFGCGPEFEGLCERFACDPPTMFAKFRRDREGFALFPLDWVGDHVASVKSVYVELGAFPKSQIFGVSDPTDDLVGFQGASAFDFWNTNTAAVRAGQPTAIPA